MFSVLTDVFSALGLAGQVKYPTPRAYFLCFVLGAVAADLIVFVMIGSSIGFGNALSLMALRFLSPMGLGIPFLGGVMATSVLWFPKNRY